MIISCAGDVNLARRMHYMSKRLGLANMINVMDFARSDLRWINLECVVTTKGIQGIDKKEGGPYYFRARPEMIKLLLHNNINIVSASNNHSGDYGPEGVLDQMQLLSKSCIQCIGVGKNNTAARRPFLLSKNETRIAFFSLDMTTAVFSATNTDAGNFYVNPHNPHGDPNYHHLLAAVNRMSKDGWLCLVSIHWGKCNNVKAPGAFQRETGRELIDSGARAIVGSSSHDYLGVETYKQCPIIYSLGDFLFDSRNQDHRSGGYINLAIRGEKIKELVFKPITLEYCRVHDQTKPESISLALERWGSLSIELNSKVEIKPHEAVIKL